MSSLLHPFTSVGSLIKKITTLNPDLTVTEILALIRQATSPEATGKIDEELALQLAKATLTHSRGSKVQQ